MALRVSARGLSIGFLQGRYLQSILPFISPPKKSRVTASASDIFIETLGRDTYVLQDYVLLVTISFRNFKRSLERFCPVINHDEARNKKVEGRSDPWTESMVFS